MMSNQPKEKKKKLLLRYSVFIKERSDKHCVSVFQINMKLQKDKKKKKRRIILDIQMSKQLFWNQSGILILRYMTQVQDMEEDATINVYNLHYMVEPSKKVSQRHTDHLQIAIMITNIGVDRMPKCLWNKASEKP